MHELVETAVREGIAHTPTLVVYEGLVKQADYARSVEEPAARLLPPVWRRVLWNPKAPWFAAPAAESEAKERKASAERLFARVKEAVALMHARGVEIRAGTDAGYPFVVPGVSLVREMELLAEVGLGEEGALEVAAVGARRALVVRNEALQVASETDMLVLRANPVLDFKRLSSVELVATRHPYRLHIHLPTR
jgi:hypothetical protein